MFGLIFGSSGGACSGDGADNPSTTDAVPTMTSNTAPSGTITFTSELVGYNGWKAFDDTTGDVFGWSPGAGVLAAHIQYQFPTSIIINKYTITGNLAADISKNPKDWTLEASATGAFAGEEVVLDTVTAASFTSGEKKTYTFVNTTDYAYYRLDVTANNGNATYLIVPEIELIETQC